MEQKQFYLRCGLLSSVSALVLEGDCVHLYGLMGQSSSQEMTASLDYSLLVMAHSSYPQGGLSC